VFAAVQNAVYAFVCELVGHSHTTVAQNATVHVQLDLVANIDWAKGSALFAVTRFG
jgi:hypothetical protein